MLLEQTTTSHLSEALDRTAYEALAKARLLAPPVDAFELARAYGLRVAVDERLAGRARYAVLSTPQRRKVIPTIWLRPDPRPERLHWAVAHELGEHLASRVLEQVGKSVESLKPAMREQLANAMASRLLLPKDLFLLEAQRYQWNLLALKRIFATASHELVARRMLDFELPIIVTVFDNGQATWRRSNVARRAPPLIPTERECWEEAQATGRPCHRSGEHFEVDVWPIHEPDWKREIMRTEVHLDSDFEPSG